MRIAAPADGAHDARRGGIFGKENDRQPDIAFIGGLDTNGIKAAA
jgi:hypothetical protein